MNVKERLLSLAREYGRRWANFNAPEDFWGWMADRVNEDLVDAWDEGYAVGSAGDVGAIGAADVSPGDRVRAVFLDHQHRTYVIEGEAYLSAYQPGLLYVGARLIRDARDVPSELLVELRRIESNPYELQSSYALPDDREPTSGG